MEISFSVSREDYWRYNIFNHLHVPKNRNSSGISIIIAAVLIIIWKLFIGSGWVAILESLMIFLVFCVVFFYIILRNSVSWFYKNDPGYFQEQTIIIDETGIREINAAADLKYSWHGIRDILQDNHNVYIYVEGSLGYVIPRRAFSSQDDAIKFFRLATLYWSGIDAVNQ
jgi:hypothetical protein